MSTYKVNQSIGPDKARQLSYNNNGKAHKEISVLSMPFKVIADATTAALVGKGNLCRIHGTAGGWVAFGAAAIGVPDVSTQTALQTEATTFLVIATDDYIRTSATIRVEVITD